jgi:hypothetical protein
LNKTQPIASKEQIIFDEAKEYENAKKSYEIHVQNEI